MKILLVSPPYRKDKIFRKSLEGVGALLPPLGLAYIAAVLEKEGHTVKIIDGPVLSVRKDYTYDSLRKDIQKFQPDIVGVTATTPQINLALKTMKVVKETSSALTFLGGPHVTAVPESILDKNCDYGIYGEGEYVFRDALRLIQKKQKPDKTRGLITKKKGKIHVNGTYYIQNLDELPMPAWHLLPMKLYKPSPANYRRLPSFEIMTSRGCPFSCAFCSKPIFGYKFRAHSPERVIKEMKHLHDTYGIKDLEIFDDTFTLNKRRVEKICQMMIDQKVDITWNCMTRVDCITPELLKLMKKAGCYQVGYGIESGSEKILERMNKKITKEKVRKAVKWANDAGLDIRGFFMFAFPGETKETARETIEFAKSLDIDIAQFMVTTPYPGTKLWDMAHQEGTVRINDWENFTFYAPEGAPYIPKGMTEKEILNIYSRAYKEFYLRPKYILRQILKTRSWTDLTRYWTAFKSVINI